MSYLLAIDIGSTGVRALVFDESENVCGSAYHELVTRFPRPGWAEQDVEEVWRETTEVIRLALVESSLAAGDLTAIGIANQRSSVVVWDAATLRPVSPLLLWHDVRATERAQQLAAQGYFINASVAVTKAEWLVRNIAEVGDLASAGRLRIGGPESYVLARLSGGAYAVDHANASATGFYAPFELGWEKTLLGLVGIDPEWMPEIVDSCGEIARTRADEFGAAVPIAGMCGDQQAALFGLGCTDPGMTKCTYGTAAMLDTNTGDSLALSGEGTYPLVAWSRANVPTWCIEGNVTTAGAAVQWLRDGLAVVGDSAETSALSMTVADSGGVWAVPAFQGLGTPFGESRARAVVGGLSRGTTRAHVVRAMLEGIAERVVDVADAVWQETARPAVLRVDGGASRNDFLMQSQADLLGMPVERSPISDGSALGAARLAAIAIGRGKAVDAMPWRPDRVFEPAISADERGARRRRWKRRLELVTADLAD